MSILFAGSPDNAALVLSRLIEMNVDISAVLTRADSYQGRKRVLTPTPVALVAEKHAIPIIKANTLDTRVVEEIAGLKFQAAIVVAFGVLLKPDAIKAIPGGWFNLHFSLLPEFRGAAPVQRAILEGRTESGITFFKIDEGLDTGDIVSALPVEIGLDETSDQLLNRLSLLGATQIAESLPAIQSGLASLKKQTGTATYAAKLSRSDAFLSFNESSKRTYNRFRAVTSEPGAWAQSNGLVFKLLDLRFSALDLQLDPGSVHLHDGKVLVQCAKGMVEILRLQPAGKSPMMAKDWLRGLRTEVRFEQI
jgi:methionyl-tRNA formyltransferase